MIKIDTTTLKYILDITPPEQNILLVGRHGIGKSKIIEKHYTELGMKVISLFLGQMSDPGDLIGLPEKNTKTGHTDFMPPYWFPTEEKPIVLFLDELNRARPEVLQTIMDLTLNRTLAGKHLPKGSRIVSAVNSGEQYTLTELDPALVSRFNVYEFMPTENEWISWAEKTGIDSRIISFISENTNYLDGTEFDKSVMGFERIPDRRSWERLSDVLKKMNDIGKQQQSVIGGIIGTAAAAKFCAFITKHRTLSASEILLAGDFAAIENNLLRLKLSEFAVLNDSVFRYLDSNDYGKNEKIVMGNLENYFMFLNSLESKEAAAHFTNLFTAGTYPKAIILIATKCEATVYKHIKDFITEIGK